jgi:O-antigen/teichoic acid export membrane protein
VSEARDAELDTPAGKRHALDGALLSVLAEALMLPTGLATAALLTRRLDADGFGLFSLAVATVAWLEWTLSSLFARATIKLVAEASDWRPVGGAAARLMLLASGAAALLVWALAGPLAAAMDEPRLAGLLALLALDIPIFCLAQTHRHILIGLGRYTQRAKATAARWVGRMVLIVALVELGFGVPGALAGHIAATVLELVIERFYVRPPLRGRAPGHLGRLWEYSWPLFLSAFSLRFYDRLDLFALTLLGGTAAQAGLYSAAQRVAMVPGLFILSLMAPLLSTLSHLLASGDSRAAGRLARQAYRAVAGTAPLAAMGAASAGEIVTLAFGPQFAPAAPLMSRLLVAVVAMMVVSVCVVVLTAHGRPRLSLALTGPLLPLAVAGHVLLIPRLGPPGAALVTSLTAAAGAVACLLAVQRVAPAPLPVATVLRSLALSSLAYALARLWPAPGWLVLLKLPALALGVGLGFALLGEFNAAERALAWNYVRRPLKALGWAAREA